MEAQSLSSHQHSWWFSCFSLREKLARSHKVKNSPEGLFYFTFHQLPDELFYHLLEQNRQSYESQKLCDLFYR